MDRPEQHVTDSLGILQLESALVPLGWALTTPKDYGVDLDVEVFRNGKSTGITFKVQLKSSRSSTYSTAGDFISQPLPVKNLRYLVDELRVPSVLVHADVEGKRTFWSALQLDDGLSRQLIPLAAESAVTIRVPTVNALPETADALVNAVVQAHLLLATRAIATAPVMDFVAVLGPRQDVEAAIRAFEEKAIALKLTQAYALFVSGELVRSQDMLLVLVEDRNAPVDSRFVAALTLDQVEHRLAVKRRETDQIRRELAIKTADRLRTIARDGPQHLKLYAVMAKKVAQLEVLMQQAWGVFLNTQMAEEHGTDEIWAARLLFDWASVTKKITKKLAECLSLLTAALIRPDRSAYADPVMDLGKAIWLYSGQLRLAGHGQPAAKIGEQAFQLYRVAAELAFEACDEQRLGNIAIAARVMNRDKDSDTHRWAMAIFAQITNPEVRAADDEALRRIERRESGEHLEFDIPTSEEQIYENMAAAAGIDLSDRTDSRAAEVLTAIKDLNPGRVLKNCEHIFIRLGPASLIGRRLHLPTAAPKVMYCTKHFYGLTGLGSLDESYAAFRREFCSSCPDAAPRPKNWVYSDEWQRAENTKHPNFVDF